MIGRPDSLQVPQASFGGERVVRIARALCPFTQRPTAGEAQHRRAVEPVAKYFECGVVAGRLPAETLDAKAREVHFLPPALRGVRLQPRRNFRWPECGEFLGQAGVGLAGQRFDRLLHGKFLEVVMQEREQREHGNLAPACAHRYMASWRREEHDVQHHPVIGMVTRVRMQRPIASVIVQLHITHNFRPFAQAQPRISKIRPAKQVPFAGMQHRHAASVDRGGRGAIEIPAEPDLLEKFFGE